MVYATVAIRAGGASTVMMSVRVDRLIHAAGTEIATTESKAMDRAAVTRGSMETAATSATQDSGEANASPAPALSTVPVRKG